MVGRARCPVLVGRKEELKSLGAALSAVREGRGQLVVVSGDAGIGKTRLCGAVMEQSRRRGLSVLSGSCAEGDLSLPFLPFTEAIGNHLAALDPAVLRAELGPMRRELGRLFPHLGSDGDVGGDVELAGSRQRLFEEVLGLLAVLAGRGGLLLLIEDLHWADPSTRQLFDYLARRVRSLRMLLLATYRAEEVSPGHPLAAQARTWARAGAQVALGALDAAEVAAMAPILGGDLRKELEALLHRRSEGNPYAVEELLAVASRAEGGAPLASVRLPRTLREAVLARVRSLPGQHAEVLRGRLSAGELVRPWRAARGRRRRCDGGAGSAARLSGRSARRGGRAD